MRIVSGFLVFALVAGVAIAADSDKMHRLDASKVKVGGEIGRRVDVTLNNNLMVVDLDGQFLAPFKEKKATGGYIGLGKTIDALAHYAVYSGDPRVMEKKKQIVSELIASQEPDGYIGYFKPEQRVFALWDIHEMSYIIWGLVSDYELCGEKASLDAARKAADYIIARWEAEPDRIPGNGEITTYMAVTCSEPAMLRLYGITGDSKYLEYCTKFRKLPEWDGPIVEGRWGQIAGHAYAYMSRAMAQLTLYRMQPSESLLAPSRKAMDFMTKQDGLTIIGTCGQHECWHNTQEGAANLGETCATAYLLRFWEDLMCMNDDPRYGDLMERAVYNALFAAQSPDGRKIRYYSPFEGPREYFKEDTYCCPCNYRRILAELPQLIYFQRNDGVLVNLYTPSEAECPLPGGDSVKLKQETAYPASDTVTIHVDPGAPKTFAVALRIPHWCKEAEVKVNGEKIAPSGKSSVSIAREWRPGDRIELRFPMGPRLVKGRVAQAGRVAVMVGPQVFTVSRKANPELEKENLRLITIDPKTLTGPFPDESVRPGGLACKVKAWRTTEWYPFGEHTFEVTLTEFPDPNGEETYLHVPNPNDESFVDDELVGSGAEYVY
ncbi:MAG: glycoside hydrolase family 127 protein [Candidatus Hydrogenedentes bacterium]|nr:glycoside hydrolase family 127 protein [Candidatus Hydrogenedentota bacterium]